MSTLQRIADRLGLDPRALLGVAMLVGGTLVWALAFTGGIAGLLSGSTHVIRADFSSIEDIVKNDPVRIDGIQVGTVGTATADPGGRGATLTLDLDSGTEPIYANASAAILWRTALGANDAIALNPGTRAAGLLGSATIPRSHDSNQVELDEITRTLNGGAQSGIRTMLQQFGPAFSAHPALTGDLTTLARIAPEATVGIGAVRGEIPDTDLRNLVRQAGLTAQALDVGTGAAVTRQFVESAASTLTSLSASQADLRATIDDAGEVLPPLATTADNVDLMLDHLDPLVRQLTPEAPQVAPTLKALHPAVVDAGVLLHHATPLLQKLRPTVDSLATSAQVGIPVIDALSPSLVRLEQKILPGLAEQGPEEKGHPAYTMIGPVFVGLGGLSSFFDNNGFMANLSLGVDPQGAQLLPCTEDFSGTDALVCLSLSESLKALFGTGTQALGGLSRPADGSTLSQLGDLRRQLTAKAPDVAKHLFRAVGTTR